MALASEIIARAYRESNVISINKTPTTAEQAEGLNLLNSLILSTIGNEAGNELCDLNIGGEFDQSGVCSAFVPENARLVLNQSAARTLGLHPQPYDGQRVAVADAGANLATYNLILDGNGRRIETTATVALNTNSLSRQWMYRGDTGNWVRLTDLVAADTMPFPTEFDDYFIISLAMRLNPRNNATTAQESGSALERQLRQIRARYRRPRPKQDMGSLGMLGQSDIRGPEDTSFYRGSF